MQSQILDKFKDEFPKSYYFISPYLKKILYSEENEEIVFNKIIEESNKIHELIKTNMNIVIYKFHDKESYANIFTIPGATSKDLLQDNSLSNSIILTKNLMKMNLKIFKQDNKIILNSNINNALLPIFSNNIPFKLLTFEERFSIYLHEIGHWVNYRMYLPSQFIYIINALSSNYILLPTLILVYTITNDITIPFIIILFFFITTIILNVTYVINELDSDKIVKEMGYGFHFSSALNKIENLKLEIKNKKTISEISKKIKIIFSLIFPLLISIKTQTHPDSKKRIGLLMAEHIEENKNILYNNFDEKDINNIKYQLIKENINYDSLLNLFKDIIPDLDNFIFLNQKHVFKF